MRAHEPWSLVLLEPRRLVVFGVSVAATGGLASAAEAALSPGCTQSGSSVTCTYTSGSNEVQIPAGVTSVHVEAIGGMGATAGGSGGGAGGHGAVVQADVPVVGPVDWWAVVGGNGADGGANGGGANGGGGESDVRTSPSDLNSRLLIAAGGGAGGYGMTYGQYTFDGGAGGDAGAPGMAGRTTIGSNDGGGGGGAGTVTAGGAGGAGGYGGIANGSPGSDGMLGVGGAGSDAGGGGGLWGGGGGGHGGTGCLAGVTSCPYAAHTIGTGGGGGGGSSLVPNGGSQSVDTKGVPQVSLSFNVG